MMKKLISLLLTLALLVGCMPLCLAPTVAAGQLPSIPVTPTRPDNPSLEFVAASGYRKITTADVAAKSDYVFESGVNMHPVKVQIPFDSKYYANIEDNYVGAMTEFGTPDQVYNICPPEDGITVLLIYRIDCQGQVYLRRFFRTLALAGWLGDPRVRIMAVEGGGNRNNGNAMQEFINTYAYDTYQNIEWYGGGYFDYFLSQQSYFSIESYKNGYHVDLTDDLNVMIFSRDTMADENGNDIPAYTMNYYANNAEMEDASILENTIHYFMPEVLEGNDKFAGTNDEEWTVNLYGELNYQAAQTVQEELLQLRLNTLPQNYANIVLDETLTELAMQRAVELAWEFGHTRPDGTAFETVWDEYGVPKGDRIGENVTKFTVTEGMDIGLQAISNWYMSDGHRENMLNYQYKRMGVGCFVMDGIAYSVQLFSSTPEDYDALCQRTDIVPGVYSARLPAERLEYEAKPTVTGLVGQTLGYSINSVDRYYTTFNINVMPPYAFSPTAVAEDGSVVATIQKSADGRYLEVTILQAKKPGYFWVQIAPEQEERMQVRVTGFEEHIHGYTAWGRWKYPNCEQEGYDRRYCSCTHYEQSEPYPIQHRVVTIPGKEPTCDSTGYTQEVYCEVCFLYFERSEFLPVLPHTPTVIQAGCEPTCTSSGWLATLYCAVCDRIYQNFAYLPMLPHTYDHPCDETCKECGNKRNDAVAHTYGGACDDTCNECGKTRTVSVSHTYSSACDEACDRCGDTRPAGGHLYDNACDDTCNRCGQVREDVHVYDSACDATCNRCGYARAEEDHFFDNACDDTCDVCGVTRPVDGHIYGGVCDTDCNECGLIRETAVDHTWSSRCDTECNKCGTTRTSTYSHTYTGACFEKCSGCGIPYPKAEHVYDNDCDPVCNKCGTMRETSHVYDSDTDAICNVCGYVRELAGGHVYDNVCDPDCNVCGAVREVEGHKYDGLCDADCNHCGSIRETIVKHFYGNDCSGYCSRCGLYNPDETHKYTNLCDNCCDKCGEMDWSRGHAYDSPCDTACNNCGQKRLNVTHTFEGCNPECIVCGYLDWSHGHIYTDYCDNICDRCGYVLEGWGHTYDSDCDEDCNECGFVRDDAHVYDNDKDAICNDCGAVREPVHTHVYDDPYSAYCNECGAYRQVPEMPISFGGTSIHEGVAGVAFRFDVSATGVQKVDGKADFSTATVDGYRLIGMGAIVTNDFDYKDVECVYLCDLSADSVSFAIRVVNIPDFAWDLEMFVMPYIIMEYEGYEIIIYGDGQVASYNSAKNR